MQRSTSKDCKRGINERQITSLLLHYQEHTLSLTCTSSLCGNAILALYLLLTWKQGYHTHSKRLSRRTVSIL